MRPYYLCNMIPDIILGSNEFIYKIKMQIDCRNYFYINSGSIEINMTVPSNYKYLHINEKLRKFVM